MEIKWEKMDDIAFILLGILTIFYGNKQLQQLVAGLYKIWENDILKTWSGEYAQVKFGFYNTGFSIGNYNQGFYAAFSEDSYYRHELGFWCKKAYVRGNIFDNKELLQKNK